MKLNLGCLANDIRKQGYVNVDVEQLKEYDSETYRQGDFECLDWLCEDESVEEIVINHSLCRLSFDTLQQTLQNWANKLAPGGTIKILTNDIYLVSKMFVQEQIPLKEYIALTFGKSNNNIKAQMAVDIRTIEELLKQTGLVVSIKRYDGMSMYLEAIKQ